MTPEQVRKIPEADIRAAAAHAAALASDVEAEEMRRVRDLAIADLLLDGWSQQQVGDLLGTSRTMVQKVAESQRIAYERKARRRT